MQEVIHAKIRKIYDRNTKKISAICLNCGEIMKTRKRHNGIKFACPHCGTTWEETTSRLLRNFR